MTRRIVALAVLALALVPLPAAPAAAHGDGAKIALNSDGLGAVWLTVVFTDGHHEVDTVDGTISARSATGDSVAPQKLVKSSAPGTFVYMGTLAGGTWDVTADLGLPIFTTCKASFTMGTTPNTTAVPCGPSPAVAAPAPAEERDVVGLVALIAAVVGALALATVALVVRRRRTTTAAPPSRRPAPRKRTGARR